MFEKLKNIFSRTPTKTFGPQTLNDPVALETGWGPAEGGGASFRTHNLHTVGTDRMEFRPTMGAKLFAGIFILVGLGISVGSLIHTFAITESKVGGEAYFLPIFGSIFFAAGIFIYKLMNKRVVFDKNRKAFWVGNKYIFELSNPKEELKVYCELTDIHAIQLVSEYCSGNDSSFYSYEINLVLKDSSRLNVVDHGDDAGIRIDAKTLGAFLDVPVWDAS